MKSKLVVVSVVLIASLLPPGLVIVKAQDPICVKSLKAIGTCGTNVTPTPPTCQQVTCPTDFACTGPKTDLFCDASPKSVYCVSQTYPTKLVKVGPYTWQLQCDTSASPTPGLVGPFACHNNVEFVGGCTP